MYLKTSRRRSCRALHIPTTSTHRSIRFRLRSSSRIFGHVTAMSFRDACHFSLWMSGTDDGPCGPVTRMPSRMTIRNSCRIACCCLIFSNPTSSTSLPLNSIGLSSWWPAGASSGAYFCLNASRKLSAGSAGREGRTNDAAVELGLRPKAKLQYAVD